MIEPGRSIGSGIVYAHKGAGVVVQIATPRRVGLPTGREKVPWKLLSLLHKRLQGEPCCSSQLSTSSEIQYRDHCNHRVLRGWKRESPHSSMILWYGNLGSTTEMIGWSYKQIHVSRAINPISLPQAMSGIFIARSEYQQKLV